jgi:hypothetical protein
VKISSEYALPMPLNKCGSVKRALERVIVFTQRTGEGVEDRSRAR